MPRVISGMARGRRLKSVPGDSTRPILDRVKENLFNLLGPNSVPGTRWLDAFAGTGQVGIEALSRGAEFCLFWDLDRFAIETIHENLVTTRLAERARVERRDTLDALAARPPADAFEYLYLAPPQYKDLWIQAVERLDANPGWLVPEGLLIVQIDPKEYSVQSLRHFELIDERTYGKTLLLFYERLAEDEG